VTRYSASELRKDTSDILNRVAYKGSRILVHRRDKDVAVIISLEDYELLKRLEDAQDRKAVRKSKATRGASVEWDAHKTECDL
jgi:prevent-host-death family protein